LNFAWISSERKINPRWSQRVRNIFNYIHHRSGVPVQAGPVGDIYHNVIGFEKAIENYEGNLILYNHPWRIYRMPSTQKEIKTYRSEEVMAKGGNQPLTVYNLVFTQAFERIQDATAFVNRINDPIRYHDFYLFQYDDYIQTL